jgi:type IV secretion system protein VirB10
VSGTQPVGVGGGKAPASPAKRIMIAVGVIFVLFILYWMGGGVPSRRSPDAVDAGVAGAMRPVMMPPPPPLEVSAPVPVAMPPERSAPFQSRPPQRSPLPKASPIMAFEESVGGATPAAARGRGDDEAGGTDGLGNRLNATRTLPARARRLRNPEMTVTQGTMIPCVRETPINSQLPGFVRCVVPEDVMGTTGNVTLIDRGTRIVGQIQNGVSHGQNRAFVLWTRLETPDHVVVELGSPGTDSLGTNGVQLDMNTNFWARFGGAIMLSFIDAGLQAAAIGLSQAANGSNGQSVSFIQLQGGGRNAAAHALDATVNIPPYGTSPQGMPEAVFVARDLDFSRVWDIRRAN